MYFVGIDPGKTGAYAIIDTDGNHVHSAGFLNWKTAGTVLTDYSDNSLIALEHVNAMPGQGVTSMFTFGANYGGWLSLLDYLQIPYILVRPQKWQKNLLGVFPKGESKARAFSYVTRRYPDLNVKKTYTGIVDAVCLALYIKDNH